MSVVPKKQSSHKKKTEPCRSTKLYLENVSERSIAGYDLKTSLGSVGVRSIDAHTGIFGLLLA